MPTVDSSIYKTMTFDSFEILGLLPGEAEHLVCMRV